jgi:hypothetical protein
MLVSIPIFEVYKANGHTCHMLRNQSNGDLFQIWTPYIRYIFITIQHKIIDTRFWRLLLYMSGLQSR